MSTLGDNLGVFSTSEGYHEYIGGYHEYIGVVQYTGRMPLVHRGDIMSTSGDIMSTVGDVPYIGDVQHIGVFNRN